MVTTRLDSRSTVRRWALTGSVMGVLAGVVFLIFEMVVAAIMGPGAFAPPRMMSAIILGEGALPMDPTISTGTAFVVGLIVHLILSAIYGAVFGAVAASVGFLRGSRAALVVGASVFGLVLWLFNFYVVAPIAFPWFLMASPLVQFFAHTFFYGSVLGLLLAGVLRESGERSPGR